MATRTESYKDSNGNVRYRKVDTMPNKASKAASGTGYSDWSRKQKAAGKESSRGKYKEWHANRPGKARAAARTGAENRRAPTNAKANDKRVAGKAETGPENAGKLATKRETGPVLHSSTSRPTGWTPHSFRRSSQP